MNDWLKTRVTLGIIAIVLSTVGAQWASVAMEKKRWADRDKLTENILKKYTVNKD